MDLEQIHKTYGKVGLTDLICINGKAQISDDTQMTLFTANGLLLGATRAVRGVSGPPEFYVYLAYKEWLETQTGMKPELKHQKTWLYNEPELHHSRAPGRTCMFGIAKSENGGTLEEPLNDSKGCGGVMRVAPMALIYGGKDIEGTVEAGARIAALTHGHPLGYIPAAALCAIIFYIIYDNQSVKEATLNALNKTKEQFGLNKYWKDFCALIEKAIKLAEEEISEHEAIASLGEGWVAEETLAIAVYCAVKYQDDFKKAIICATNHDGDSDSTGAVCGNILGAYLGLERISIDFPPDRIELSEVILEIAEDLFNGCPLHDYGGYTDKKWISKYIDATYKKSND